MKLNKQTLLALTMAAILALSFSLTACGSSDSAAPLVEEDVAVDDTANLSLMDDPESTRSGDPKLASKAEKLNEDPESFYGTWVSTSPDAENLYGNLEITILENGTFVANITGEKLRGKWKKIDGGIEYKNELISGKIYYGPTCIMTFEEFAEDEENDDIEVVLIKKPKQ